MRPYGLERDNIYRNRNDYGSKYQKRPIFSHSSCPRNQRNPCLIGAKKRARQTSRRIIESELD